MLRNKKGFTLIELMVVIVIIGILAALAIPKFTSASDKAKWSEVPSVIASYENAQLAHVAETSVLGDTSELVFTPPSDSKWFAYAQGANAGIYQATVNTTGDIGGIAKDEGVNTSVSDQSVVTHGLVTTDSAHVKRMMPNFF